MISCIVKCGVAEIIQRGEAVPEPTSPQYMGLVASYCIWKNLAD